VSEDGTLVRRLTTLPPFDVKQQAKLTIYVVCVGAEIIVGVVFELHRIHYRTICQRALHWNLFEDCLKDLAKCALVAAALLVQ